MNGRRDVLATAWKGALWLASATGIGVLLRALTGAPRPTRQVEVDLRLVARAGPAGAVVEPGLLVRGTEEKPEVLSLACTHMRCRVAALPEGGFACPCHGSRYDDGGRPVSGPATRPLARPRVEKAGGRLLVRL